MPRKKPAKPTRKRRSQQESARKDASRRDSGPVSSPDEPQKKHLSPLATAGIVAVFAIILAAAVWFYLKSEDQRLAGDNSKSDSTQKKNTKVEDPLIDNKNDDLPAWASLENADKIWETESSRKETWQNIDNPSEDGWDTEVFNNRANEQFDRLKKLLISEKKVDASSVDFMVSPDFGTANLVPENLQTVFEDDSMLIRRGTRGDESNGSNTESGPAHFATRLSSMLYAYESRKNLRAKLKVFRVKQVGDTITTRQSVELFGTTTDGVREENAIWEADWAANGERPLLKNVRWIEYESVQKKGNRLFTDVTLSALEKNDSFKTQLLQHYDQYLDRMQFNRLNSILGTPGIAIGDLNGDRLEDIYVCQESGLPNLLFFQNPDGTLTDHSRESGVDWLHNSATALIVDIDNDGHNDLAVGLGGGVVLAKGDGAGKFSVQTILDSSDHVMTIAAADYNLDGKLDFYVGAYYPDGIDRETEDIVSSSRSEQRAYGDADDDGGPNQLFENRSFDGNWKFNDVTTKVGLDTFNHRLTWASAWEDFDNDGDQDLYVANDYGLNCLFRNERMSNQEHRFVEISAQSNVEDAAFSMSVAWADYDRDGWMDLYISNMFSYAGNRITFQDQFQANANDSIRKGYQRFARGNTLLRNLGSKDGPEKIKFEDRSLEENVNRARWAWGSRFVDLNNDGWDDLVVANGYITTADTGDL